jgi:hypothetical protein
MNTFSFNLTGLPFALICGVLFVLAICAIAIIVANSKSEKLEQEKARREKLQAINKNMAKVLQANLNLQNDAFEARKEMIYEAFMASCEKPPLENARDEDADWRQQ